MRRSAAAAAGSAHWAVNRVAARLPAPLGSGVGRVLTSLDAPKAASLVPPVDGGANARLLIGPRNTAGQAQQWARAVTRELAGAEARSFLAQRHGSDPAYRYATDIVLPTWLQDFGATAFATRVAAEFTHVLCESAQSVLGDFHSPMSGRRDLDRLGLKAAILLHGSEIRDPARHAESYPGSPFATADPEWDRLTSVVSATRTALGAAGLPVFVSTPDLLDFAPGAHWLPVTIEASRFERAGEEAGPALRRGRPVVVHAPSNPRLKGTTLIEPVLRALDQAGRITYRRLSGIPNARMARAVAEADVVVDQIVLGNPGVLAAEAMAAGRLVVAHVAPRVRARYGDGRWLRLDGGAPDEAGPRDGADGPGVPATAGEAGALADGPPIVDATPATLADVLEDVLERRDRYSELARLGPEFSRRVHDGRAAAWALADFLGVAGG